MTTTNPERPASKVEPRLFPHRDRGDFAFTDVGTAIFDSVELLPRLEDLVLELRAGLASMGERLREVEEPVKLAILTGHPLGTDSVCNPARGSAPAPSEPEGCVCPFPRSVCPKCDSSCLACRVARHCGIKAPPSTPAAGVRAASSPIGRRRSG